MASKSLGTLTIDLIAKVGGFVSGMDKAERSSAKWRKQVESDVKAAGAALATIGVAAATAAVSASAAGIALLKSTSDQITETDRWAKSLRMSTQDLLAWQFAAEKAGITGDQMADIFKDIGDKIGDAVLNKSGEAVDALDALGLSAEKLSKTTPEKQLLAISDALSKVKTNAEKTTILESLGNDLSRLLPLFDNNNAKLNQFIQLAKDYGVAPDEKSINDLLKVSEVFQDLELQAKGLKVEIASGLAKVDLTPIQKGLDDLKLVFTDPAVLEGLAKLVGGVAELVGWMGKLASESANFLSHITEIPDRAKAGGWANYNFQTGLNDKAQALLGDLSAITGPQKTKNNNNDEDYKGGPNGKQTADAGAKKLENAFKATEQSYLRQIALIDTTGKKTAEVTEQQKLQFDIADGKLEGLNATQRQRLEQLATEVDRLNAVKKANEDNLKVAEYVANLQRENANNAATLNADIVGAGMGDKTRDRMRERLAVEREFNEKRADLQLRYLTGEIKNQGEYDRYTGELEKAQAERLGNYESYYQQIDQLDADWVTGARDGLANWVDDATNYSSQAASVMQSAMSGITSNIVDMLNDNEASWKDWSVSVLKSIQTVLVNMAIANAVSSIGSLFSFGAAAGGSTPSGSYASAAAGVKLNAKGGVYESADLSKFSNSIVNSPTMFAFAKGAGLMGEAGPEAIMPLTRAADGSLGVRALDSGQGQGGGLSVSIGDINFNSQTQQPASQGIASAAGRQLTDAILRTVNDEVSRPGTPLWRAIKGV
ncbi:phage tail tape measure protein [Enterobacter hormaechei]|uniref:phage tail tape measure protein n=1 Tax=Enterobacter hormaechei TaxID=158836 RepID=UPI0014439970|nr:phage tail tape measure protein [Enterobacter hormaechei]MBJ6525997.1 phage tail tape measure protein [Enterobacter hormaechei]MBK4517248.1 phage tail tape measure protein [Enterobacter hormaechei]MEA3885277.1 phage tail tape measure protein [Enterobacter hormaechei]MEA3887925.1 phage tail tape measure protein [Enterobacter hormaechei]MEA3894941.1 phage tail tape measure protein [Enterobacter hormaechei]